MNADPIAEFYSRHPYPPPVDNLDRAREEWRDGTRARAEYHLFWPGRPHRTDLDILVAGCGTWQAAKVALCRPDARVVAIDVSATSLDHTERLKRQYALANLETRDLPIERAAALDRQFDLVVCTGVLHHLADPEAGLRALGAVLNPGGAIHLMLYARYGRAGIYMLQDYCRRLGIGATDGEIADLLTVLKALSPQHPLASVLGGARDAQHTDALADALLNPRDRAYSVPELLDLVDRSGLAFGRWHLQAPYLPQCGAMASTPHAGRLAALPEREQYAAMELWRGTMTTHTVALRPADAHAGSSRIRFDDDRWPRYVPIRLPHTLCVQERLPAGAAAVLLNRSHQHHDLVLPIDAQEKRTFDGIDSRRSVAEIVDLARNPTAGARARGLFERLWRYDQVVFDVSRAS